MCLKLCSSHSIPGETTKIAESLVSTLHPSYFTNLSMFYRAVICKEKHAALDLLFVLGVFMFPLVRSGLENMLKVPVQFRSVLIHLKNDWVYSSTFFRQYEICRPLLSERDEIRPSISSIQIIALPFKLSRRLNYTMIKTKLNVENCKKSCYYQKD